MTAVDLEWIPSSRPTPGDVAAQDVTDLAALIAGAADSSERRYLETKFAPIRAHYARKQALASSRRYVRYLRQRTARGRRRTPPVPPWRRASRNRSRRFVRTRPPTRR